MLMNYWIIFKNNIYPANFLQLITNTSIQNSINEERKKQNLLTNPQKKTSCQAFCLAGGSFYSAAVILT